MLRHSCLSPASNRRAASARTQLRPFRAPACVTRVSSASQQHHLETDYKLLYGPSSDGVPLPLVGPIKAVQMEGKGRGIVATERIATGQLLLATEPVAYLQAPNSERPSGEDLVDHIIDAGLWRQPWVESLFDGQWQSASSVPDLLMAARSPSSSPDENSSSSSSSSPDKKSSEADSASAARGSEEDRAASGEGASTSTSSPGGSDGGAGDGGGPTGSSGLSRDQVMRIVKLTRFNCFGDTSEDTALCALSGRPSAGHIGIWGPFAMLNHSCAPNTMNYVVDTAKRGVMIVRAAKDIAKGEEVTICYMGRPQLQPIGVRQTKLLADYGFECDCHRCRQERVLEEKINEDLYEGLWEEVTERRRPELDEACLTYAETGDETDLQALQERLQSCLNQLLGNLQKMRVSPGARQCILGSMYELFELKMDTELALDYTEDFVYTLNLATRAVQGVSPGSDLAVSLASANIVSQASLHGTDAPQVSQAKALSDEALVARYGHIRDDALRSQLRKANLTVYS